MFFLRMALRSIVSHRRRSIVIAVSVLVSVVVMLFVQGMLSGLRTAFFENLQQGTGHLQVHAAGWQNRLDPYSLKFLLRDPAGMIRTIRGDPRAAASLVAVEPLLQFGALLVNGDRNVAMAGQGVLPSTRFFSDVRAKLVQGRFLAGVGGPGIALSTSTAGLLNLHLHDPVVVLVQDVNGSPYYLSYTVTGIYDTGVSQTDEDEFFISLADAQDLLGAADEATELRLTLRSPDAAPAEAERLAALFPSPAPFIQTWRDLQGGLVALIRLGDIYTTVIDIIIVVVAAMVITSSILMTIFQRIPTFGTLRAIGLKRRQLFAILMEEGFLLGMAGSLLGMAAGLPLVLRLQSHGLDVGAFARVLGTTSTYHFSLSIAQALTIFAAGVLIAVGGYLYGASVSVRTPLLASLEQGV